jgi:hypothetical protein
MRLQREHVPAGLTALAAVVLAVPSLVAATWRVTTLDSESGVVLFDQYDWSWGRSQELGAGGAVVQDLWNPWGLVALVALLAVAAAGAVAWLASDAHWVRVLAPVSTGALLGRLATTVPARLGRPVRDDVHGLAASGASTPAGLAETAAAVVLVATLALMVSALTATGPAPARLPRTRPMPAGSPPGAFPPRGGPRRLPPVVAGRAPVAALGVAGALLAVPQLFWPTHTVGVRSDGPSGGFTFRQSIWSWGRYADTTLEDANQFDVSNPFSLTLLALSIVVCVAACAAYALRRGTDGRVLGAAGLGCAVLGLGAPLVQRVGDTMTGLYGDNPLMEVETHLTGWLQWVSVGLLVTALVLVAARPAARTARATWPGLVARLARLREVPEVEEAPDAFAPVLTEASPAPGSDDRAPGGPGGWPGSSGTRSGSAGPRIGIATLQDASARDHSGSRSGAVGFSDDAGEADGAERPRHPDAS